MLKSKFRAEMRAKLAQISKAEYRAWNNGLEQLFFQAPVVQRAERIMIYYSVRNEAVTTGIIQKLFTIGKTVALPICIAGRNLRAGLIANCAQLVPAKFGLFEPKPESETIAPEQLELIVVPGLAFDVAGHRLGHGAGYYDRFLVRAPNAVIIGLAYDFQVLPEIPTEKHDIAMNAIITPTRVIEIQHNEITNSTVEKQEK